jgi:hypothetical protein
MRKVLGFISAGEAPGCEELLGRLFARMEMTK